MQNAATAYAISFSGKTLPQFIGEGRPLSNTELARILTPMKGAQLPRLMGTIENTQLRQNLSEGITQTIPLQELLALIKSLNAEDRDRIMQVIRADEITRVMATISPKDFEKINRHLKEVVYAQQSGTFISQEFSSINLFLQKVSMELVEKRGLFQNPLKEFVLAELRKLPCCKIDSERPGLDEEQLKRIFELMQSDCITSSDEQREQFVLISMIVWTRNVSLNLSLGSNV